MKLKYILNTKWWFMNDRYSKRWDIELNRLIDQDNGVIDYMRDGTNYFTINFGDISVWVTNYPYGFGTPNGNKGIPSNIRPSRETIERLKNYVESIEKKELLLNKY
jgi:hypothetical protein